MSVHNNKKQNKYINILHKVIDFLLPKNKQVKTESSNYSGKKSNKKQNFSNNTRIFIFLKQMANTKITNYRTNNRRKTNNDRIFKI